MSWLTPAVFIVVACMAVYTIVRAVRERRRREKRLRELRDLERWAQEFSCRNKGVMYDDPFSDVALRCDGSAGSSLRTGRMVCCSDDHGRHCWLHLHKLGW